MAESRNRRPKDRNTFVSTAADPLDRQLRRLRSDTDNVKLEVESLPAAAVAAPEIDLSSLDLSGGGGVIIGTVVSFDPNSQVATVTLSNGFTTDMLSFATFQLATNDVVSCVPLQDESGYVITGVSRLPNYVPPSWAIPTVSEDYPLQLDVYPYPPSGFHRTWTVDANNELGYGAGAIVACSNSTVPAVTIVTPGAVSIVNLVITTAYSSGTGTEYKAKNVAIFDGRLFVVAPFTNRYYCVHVFTPGSGWYRDSLTSATISNVTPMVSISSFIDKTPRFAIEDGKLYHFFGALTYTSGGTWRCATVLCYISPGQTNFTMLKYRSTTNTEYIQVKNNSVWTYNASSNNILHYYLSSLDEISTSFGTPNFGLSTAGVPISFWTADISHDGDIFWIDATTSYIDLYAVRTSSAAEYWANAFDPFDMPYAAGSSEQDTFPALVCRPDTQGLYVSGVVRSTDGVDLYETPAIWSIDTTPTAAATTRVWTGDLHTTLYPSNMSAATYFIDQTNMTWFVSSVDGVFYYQGVL